MNYNKESLEEKARVDRHNENLLALTLLEAKIMSRELREYASTLAGLVSRIGGGCLIAGGGGAILHQALTLSREAYRHSEALIKERSYGEGIIVGGFEIGMAGAFTLLGYSFIKIGYHLINKDQQSAKKRSGVQKGEND